MKIGNHIPQTLIKAAEKDGRIVSIHNEGQSTGGDSDYKNDYWLQLADGWGWAEIGTITESTVKGCIQAMRHITPLPESLQIQYYGKVLIVEKCFKGK